MSWPSPHRLAAVSASRPPAAACHVQLRSPQRAATSKSARPAPLSWPCSCARRIANASHARGDSPAARLPTNRLTDRHAPLLACPIRTASSLRQPSSESKGAACAGPPHHQAVARVLYASIDTPLPLDSSCQQHAFAMGFSEQSWRRQIAYKLHIAYNSPWHAVS